MSKFTRDIGEDATITEWVPPVIEKGKNFSINTNSGININSDFVDIDFSKKLDSSNSKLDKNFIKSRDDGYNDGYKIGQHEAESLLDNEVKRNLDLFKRNIEILSEPLRILEKDVEKELAELAILIAEKMIHDHIRHKPQTIINLIGEAIKLSPNKDRLLTISINPEDLVFIKENQDMLEEVRCKFIEDDSLKRGGMLIQSDDVKIDLSLEKRMHDLVSQFFESND